MSQNIIQEIRNGSIQLSNGRYYLLCNKYKKRTGYDVVVLKISELQSDRNNPDVSVFHEHKTFFLSQHEFNIWIALLIQISEKKTTIFKGSEPDVEQKKL
jgi:hypothetical protein